MSVPYSREVIAELRHRVAQHNEACPERQVRLGELKARYGRHYQGQYPHEAALNKIDGWLNDLAKAFEPGDHPRGGGGRFSSKGKREPLAVHVALPVNEVDHRRLQETNAGYRALTTDLLPDTRHQLAGAAIRTATSAAIAGAAVLSAYRGRPNGALARILGAAGAKAGGAIAGATSRFGTTPGIAASFAVRRAARRAAIKAGMPSALTPSELKPERAAQILHDTEDAITGAGARIGRATLRAPVVVAHHLLVHPTNFMEARLVRPLAPNATAAAHLSHGLKRMAARSIVPVAATVAASSVINNQWQRHGWADPEQLGRAEDAFSWRTVQKIAGGDLELTKAVDDTRARVLAAANGSATLEEVLEKSAGTKLAHATAGFLIGLAGIGGAAAGAGAAHALRHGNPYRDAHGRYTSKANAVSLGGAALGALAGVGLAYRAVRSHNAGRFGAWLMERRGAITNEESLLQNNGALAHLYAEIEHEGPHALNFNPRKLPPIALNPDGTIAKVQSPEVKFAYGKQFAWHRRHGDLATLVGNADSIVNAAAAKDPKLVQTLADIELYGGANPEHYRNEIAKHINDKLGEAVAGTGRFSVKGKGGKWTELKGDFSSVSTAASKAIGRMNAEEFDVATAAIHQDDPKLAAQMRELFASRQAHIGRVSAYIAEQQAKISAAHTALRDAEETAKKAAARLELTPDVPKRGYDAAMKAHTAAADAVDAAEKVLDRVKGQGPIDVPGMQLKPFDQAAARLAATKAARETAATAHAKLIAEMKTQKLGELRARQLRLNMAAAHMTPGAIPAKMRAAGKALEKARGEWRAAKAATMAARAARNDAKIKFDAAKAALSGKIPNGGTVVDADALRNSFPHIEIAFKDARAAEGAAVAHENAKYDDAQEALRRFLNSGTAATVQSGRVHWATSKRFVRELQMMTGGGGIAFKKFVAYPTARNWSAFMQGVRGEAPMPLEGKDSMIGAGARSVGGAINVAYSGLKAGAKGAYEGALYQGGKLSPLRAWGFGTGGAVLGATVAGEVSRDAYHFAKDKLLGDKPTRKAARLKTMRYEEETDPFSGAGFRAVTVAHPTRKDDRIVLYGEHFGSQGAEGTPLVAGGSIAAVREKWRKQAQGNNAPGGGYAGASRFDTKLEFRDQAHRKLINDAIEKVKGAGKLVKVSGGGAEMQFRDKDENEQGSNQARDILRGAVNRAYMGQGSPTGENYYRALGDVTHSNQSRIFHLRDVYRMITGYGTDGTKSPGHGIFSSRTESAGFGSNDATSVGDALTAEVTHAINTHKLGNDFHKAVLTNAVAAIAAAKDVPATITTPLYSAIREAKAAAPAAGASEAPRAGAAGAKPFIPDPGDIKGAGKNWAGGELTQHAKRVAQRWLSVVHHGETPTRAQRDAMDLAVSKLALVANKIAERHGTSLTAEQAVGAVDATLADLMHSTTPGGAPANEHKFAAAKKLLEGRWTAGEDVGPAFIGAMETLDGHVQRLAGMQKGFAGRQWQDEQLALEDPLEKAWSDLLAGADSGDATSQALSGPALAAKETVDGVIDYGTRPKPQATPGASKAPWNSRKRLAPELASYAAGDAAFMGARALSGALPAVVRYPLAAGAALVAGWAGQRAGEKVFAPKGVQPLKQSGAAAAGNLAGNIGGAVAGGSIGSSVGELLGQIGGFAAGGVAGSYGGGALGATAGQMIGSTLGAWAGGHAGAGVADSSAKIGARVARHFQGFDPAHATRALTRYSTPPAPKAPRAPRQRQPGTMA